MSSIETTEEKGKFDSELESFDRNTILTQKHKKLPSYCFWDSYDIEKESIKERYDWWKTVETTEHKIKQKWIDYYKMK